MPVKLRIVATPRAYDIMLHLDVRDKIQYTVRYSSTVQSQYAELVGQQNNE